MDGWGGRMLAAVRLVAAAAAVGFGLPADALTSLMDGGPHLLAPTGSDLGRHGARGTVLAGARAGAGLAWGLRARAPGHQSHHRHTTAATT